jgi:hypothetical protein
MSSSGRFSLSRQQELWCYGDQGDEIGTFGPRFIMVEALRIAGQVDVAALQSALDEVVARHEMLRTVVVRDATPPCQEVRPPCPVPLTVRDLPPAPGSRDQQAEDLLTHARQGTLSPRQIPLLRADLARFDEHDAVLLLSFHHSATDEWSIELALRDLAAYYAAGTAGPPAALPPAPPYREFAAGQHEPDVDLANGAAPAYWREKLSGARVFALPTDRDVPDTHRRAYSARSLTIPAAVSRAAVTLARDAGASIPMVLLATVNVLAHDITGTTDPVIDTFTSGRGSARYRDTFGPFLNFYALRTDISEASTFREILIRTRNSYLEADAHEIPIQDVQHELPDLMSTYDHPRKANTIFGVVEPQFDLDDLRIADGAQIVRNRLRPLERVAVDIPIGLAWTMEIQRSGELQLYVQYNLEEFDDQTVAGWTEAFSRILTGAVADPDGEWKRLCGRSREDAIPALRRGRTAAANR